MSKRSYRTRTEEPQAEQPKPAQPVKTGPQPPGPTTCRGDSGPASPTSAIGKLLDANAAAVRSALNPGTPDKCRD
jgi:hypothetical protein